MSRKPVDKVSPTPNPANQRQINAATGICFFRVDRAQSLKEFLAGLRIEELDVEGSSALAEEWLRYGSLYVDGVRQTKDGELKTDQILRLHTRRKSYFDAHADLRPRIVLEREGFLILDKPAGLPTHPTLDNYLENAQILLSRAMGKPIYVTHRLDVATQGLLILAKTPEMQRGFNRLFSKGKVNKFYRALTERPVPIGTHTHFIDPNGRLPREVSIEPREGWWECRLEVQGIERTSEGFLHDVKLLTGKTHQIRSQFAHLGAPLLGDTLYGAPRPCPGGAIGLECRTLEFSLGPESFTVTRELPLATQVADVR